MSISKLSVIWVKLLLNNTNKYYIGLAPDRSELQAMTQNDKETFKEYAQRWREFAAQVRPPLEENELTKIFLNTLDSFYYQKMFAGAFRNFAEMMTMGMRIEEAIREGRLVKESVPSNSFEDDFSEGKDQEVCMGKGWPQQQNPVDHPH